MVTSSKGRKRARDEEGGVAVGAVTLGRAQATKAKRKEAVLQDFYRFQQREKRRGELLELREKFERDKQKVLHVKGERRFLK